MDAIATDYSDRRKGQLHGAAVASLREMIVSGRMTPGAFLREKELCQELDISRTPLREAIRTLAREGLVKLIPNRGALVADLDLGEVEALFHTVGHLEALAARLACDRASDDEIDSIEILHHRMMIHYRRRNLKDYIEINQAIHRSLVVASGNFAILEAWDLLTPRVLRARSLANLYPARWEAAVVEHEEMLAALTARDGQKLSELMIPHYLNGLAEMRRRARNASGEREASIV